MALPCSLDRTNKLSKTQDLGQNKLVSFALAGPRSRARPYFSLGFGGNTTITSARHFLCYHHDEFAVGLRGFAQALPQFVKIGRLFAASAKRDVVRRFSLKEM